MRVAGRGAIGDHGDRFRRGVRRPILDLDVEHGGEAAKPLRADAERVDLFIQLDAQFLGRIARPACEQFGHVDRVHQRLFGKQHCLFGGAADADAEHAGRAPARAHLGHHFEYPVDDRIRRVHHLELRLVLAAAALRRDVDDDLGAGNHLDIEDRGGVVLRIDAAEGRIGEDRGAQLVVGMEIGAADAFIDDLLQAAGRVEAAVHAPFDEHGDDAGVLADRAVPLGAHAAVRQDLRHRVLRGGRHFAFVCGAQRADIVHRVEIADVLERVGDGFDEVVLADDDGVHVQPFARFRESRFP